MSGVLAHEASIDEVCEGRAECGSADTEMINHCDEFGARMMVQLRDDGDIPPMMHEADQRIQIRVFDWRAHLTNYILSIKIEPLVTTKE